MLSSDPEGHEHQLRLRKAERVTVRRGEMGMGLRVQSGVYSVLSLGIPSKCRLSQPEPSPEFSLAATSGSN